MSKPIIIIPGLGASILINRKQPYNYYFGNKILNNRWVNLNPFSTKYMERWKKDMYMDVIRNDTTNKIIGYQYNNDIVPYDMYGINGIQNLVHEFDRLNLPYRYILQEAFHYQYMYDLNQHLIQFDYTPHKNLIGMPYDFRLMLDPTKRTEYFKKLKYIIEHKYCEYNQKTFIISHSLGGIIFKWFLSEYVDQQFIDKYIDKIIIVNSPFGGTPNAIKACLFGEFYVPFMQSLFSDFTGKVSGIVMSLPNTLCYKNNDTFIHIDNSSKPIKFESLFNSSNLSFQLWEDLYLPYINSISKPINVNTKLVISTENQTAKCFYTKNLKTAPYKIDYDMNGDGLIPSKSLNYATKIFNHYEMLHIPKSDHVGILSHPIFLNHIEKWLLED